MSSHSRQVTDSKVLEAMALDAEAREDARKALAEFRGEVFEVAEKRLAADEHVAVTAGGYRMMRGLE